MLQPAHMDAAPFLGATGHERIMRPGDCTSLNSSYMTTDCGEILQPKGRGASGKHIPDFSSCSTSTETQDLRDLTN